jgi:hypothetical protein
MLRRTPFILALAVGAWGLVAAQQPAATSNQDPPAPQAQSGQTSTQSDNPNVLILKAPQAPPSVNVAPELRAVELEKRGKLTPTTRMQLIRLMTAEFAHTRKYFPLGDKSLTINPQGQVIPGDVVLFQQAQLHGVAAKVGDKVQITAIAFHEKSITLQLNGGAKKKTKWYQHIQVGVGGSGGTYSPNDTVETPTGAEMTLQFSKDIPEMNAEELRKLLSPVLDFSVKSAAEVYAETLPPKIRDAIKNHEVLVGMNREMVVAAKERPPQKDREKDDKGKEYEEWIYGTPPQDVIFVRFYGDEVTQVKTAKVGGQVVTKTEKEVDVKDGVVTLAVLQASSSPQDVKPEPNQPQQQPAHKPTLRREGEQPETEILRAPNGQTTQQTQPSHPDEPEWGTKGQPQQQQPQGGQPPQQTPQKPPQ